MKLYKIWSCKKCYNILILKQILIIQNYKNFSKAYKIIFLNLSKCSEESM